MTYIARMNAIEAERINVTRERTGLALKPESMTQAAYERDLATAISRLQVSA